MVNKGLERVIKLLLHNREVAAKKRVKDERDELEHMANMIQLSNDVETKKGNIDGIDVIWLKTPGVEEESLIIYLHGGSYTAGSFNSHKDLVQRLSREAKCKIITIEYGLAPEHPFPKGLNDVIKIYNWLINEEKYKPNKIVIVGDSAGGGLALATLVKLRDLGIKLPAAGVCLSPWTDLAFTGESCYDKNISDPGITLDDLMFAAKLYIGNNDPKNPYISPVYADLKGLPPLLIHVGTIEKLLNDSTRVAESAKKAGVNVTLKVWNEMIHVFQAYAVLIREGEESIKEIGSFILNHFA
jgi:monoterpene epsilon-lactone hydrolase